MEWLIKFLNPAGHWNHTEYAAWWNQVLSTTLLGFWGKFFTALFIFIGVWVGARMKQMQVAFCLLAIAALIMYGGGLWSFVRR